MANALGEICPSPPAAFVIDVQSVALEMSNTDVVVADELSTSSHSPYLTNAVQVRKRGHSSMITRARKKGHLNTATDSSAAFVKKKNVMDVTGAAESFHLSSEAVATKESLTHEIWTAFRVKTDDFLKLYKTHEL